MRRFLVIALAGVVVAIGPAANGQTQQTQTERLKPYVQPSLVRLHMEWEAWVFDRHNDSYLNNADPFTVGFGCTGFVVNPEGYIATAGHCVDPADVEEDFLAAAVDWVLANDYYETTPDEETAIEFALDDYRVEGEGDASPVDHSDLTLLAEWSADVSGISIEDGVQARVVDWADLAHGDVALLKIEANGPMSGIQLANTSAVSTGTSVVSIGYPGSVENVSDADINQPSFKEGTVSSVRTTGGGLYEVFEMSAELSGGMSGGPTVNNRGQVIGVNSYGPAEETGAFNFVQSVATLEEMMAGAGVDNTLGPVASSFHAGLEAYYAGDKEAAIDNFDRVLGLTPSHGLAQQFRGRANELPDPTPWLLYIGLAAGVLVIGGVGFLFVKGRRRPQALRSDGRATDLPPMTSMPDQRSSTPTVTPAGPEALVQTVSQTTQASPGSDKETVGATGEAETDRFCENCGKPMSALAKYCGHCGATAPARRLEA